MQGFGWSPYVPVAVRRARAARKMDKLRKKGMDIQPVEIAGRKIAHSFWGKSWCGHLEKFSDFANRLPRGRTYVRNGSVCHLEIKEGAIKAIVSGSELYNVEVKITELLKKKWNLLKKRCAGNIGSLLDLLEGKLSKGIMTIVTDRQEGLFPLPKEIRFTCDCPDWAHMCKHVAAVLYGVGARLDERPELLFVLRGVNHEEMITAGADLAAVTGERGGKRRRLASGELSEVFGIEMTEPERSGSRSRKKKKAKGSGTKRGKTASRKKPIPAATGRVVASLRGRFDMTQSEFARLLGVSVPTISNWENTRGKLNLQARTLAAWKRAACLSKSAAWKKLDKKN